MCVKAETLNAIQKKASKKGLKIVDSHAGLVVYNGSELFIIQMSDDKPKKLFHQNYDVRKFDVKKVLNWADIDRDYMFRNFHEQTSYKLKERNYSVDDILDYIKWHHKRYKRYRNEAGDLRKDVLAAIARGDRMYMPAIQTAATRQA